MFKANKCFLFSVLCKKPWDYAKLKIQQNKPILEKASGGSLTLCRELFHQHFGPDKGSELFDEISVVMQAEREDKEKRDLIYIAIWKILRCDWVNYIASVKRKRSSSNKCMFSTMFDVLAILQRFGSFRFSLAGLKHVFSGKEVIMAGYSVLTKCMSYSSE